MARVPRELFVPRRLARRAYEDAALPIGAGQTVSQPFIVALICQALALEGGERVLDVGTGSGYQAAVLAELAGEVHSIERIPELAEAARAALADGGYERVEVHVGDGSLGLPEHAPYDGIAVAAAAPELPRGALGAAPRGRPDRAAARRRGGGRSSASVERTPDGPQRARRRAGAVRAARAGRRAVPVRVAGGSRGSAAASLAASWPCSDEPRRPGAQAPAQLGPAPKFGVVGAIGYVVNLAVYALLLGARRPHGRRDLVRRRGGEQLLVEPPLDVRRHEGQLRATRGPLLRRLVAAFARNQLWLFVFLDWLGLGKLVSQAIAIVLVMPLNFLGNKLWSFRALRLARSRSSRARARRSSRPRTPPTRRRPRRSSDREARSTSLTAADDEASSSPTPKVARLARALPAEPGHRRDLLETARGR